MGIVDFFKKVDWNVVKQTTAVYPQNSFSLVMGKTDNGKVATGWINLAYKDYNFKKFCPYNFQLSIEIDNNKSQQVDIEYVENYFIDKLQKVCIVHAVSRMMIDDGMIMDFYIDNVDLAEKTFNELYQDPTKLVEFGCAINFDPRWEEYVRILTANN